ncbi:MULTISPECIES: 2-oxo-4-hydroxy-4-carboxy-5-ureidoimidazoline decarboxylase [unclassified Methylobacterium]|uniref:2-oxo-4-hydroxy-4-carboxy-5-ureidoimidazoline decarboxylase n=1 Tax=unclassified Methylobacterium TaxID=2615210 RepID=UPI0006FFDA04|nr:MULTISPECIES: 2-oxo-4-hydroxy-4-carboxy-5-ureidoimidazoline decarboxylase [unclassified Methylobacterium]KQO58119.1 OHCU decarboxylase [Methylobacterium sp. Leaf86]KQO97177.1 OHCU decarboxylase [Methylobacterium sp. Leaf91]
MSSPAALDLTDLNAATVADFVSALGAVFEHAPWVAEAAAGRRPFATVAELFSAMRGIVEEASDEDRLALLTGHPELAGRAARSGDIAADSVAEQAYAGLDRLSGAEYARFEALNAAYSDTFGFPFILCIKRHGRASLLRTFEQRLASTPAMERATAEEEVFRIAAIRLDALVKGEGRLRTTGRVSTHVLDTASGRPAAGVAVSLYEWVSDDRAALVASTVTNADGRTDAPLIGGRPVPIAAYELRFGIGDHFRRTNPGLPEPPFLDIVTLRFGVSDPEGHYHVPLVASPWSYQTYRGS